MCRAVSFFLSIIARIYEKSKRERPAEGKTLAFFRKFLYNREKRDRFRLKSGVYK